MEEKVMSTKMKVRITLTEEMLGMSPNDQEVYKKFIASKAPDAKSIDEEVESVGVDEVVEKGTTIFPKLDDGTPFMWDYQMKGFFKDACGMLQRVTSKDEKGKKKKAANESSKISSYKKVIDGIIFTFPRKIPIHTNVDEMGQCQRPLRASTAQGERIALASSETVPAGSTIEFTILSLNDDYVNAIKEWLDYGELRGLGQWRNSGVGRFTYEILEESTN